MTHNIGPYPPAFIWGMPLYESKFDSEDLPRANTQVRAFYQLNSRLVPPGPVPGSTGADQPETRGAPPYARHDTVESRKTTARVMPWVL